VLAVCALGIGLSAGTAEALTRAASVTHRNGLTVRQVLTEDEGHIVYDVYTRHRAIRGYTIQLEVQVRRDGRWITRSAQGIGFESSEPRNRTHSRLTDHMSDTSRPVRILGSSPDLRVRLKLRV
jgi:hypothetical protein